MSAAFASVWALERAACGAVVVVCLLGFGLTLRRSGSATAAPPCPRGRATALILLPALGLLVVAAVTRPLVPALRVAEASLSFDRNDANSQARLDAVLAREGLALRGSASLAETSSLITRAVFVGVYGGAAAAGLLVSLGIVGLLLARRGSFGAGFSAAAGALWLLAAAGAALVASGVVDPLRVA